MEAGRLTSLDENLHVSCFDVCVARGGCGRMKPASSNFSAPRTYVFDLIGGTGAGTTDSIRDFLRGIFRRVAPKPKRPSRTPNRTQWRREDKIAIISGASAPSERSHRAGFAVCCLVICDTRARHHGGHGRRPERRRDLHVRGAMARVRDELECECPSMTLLRPAAFLPARANPSPAPHSDPARSAADATLRTRPAVDRRAPRRDLTR